jgi:hypothetical protein
LAGEAVPGLDDPRQALRDIGLLVWSDGTEKIRKEDERNVPRFLNRILALEVEPQNALFNYFADLFDQTVRYAKATGTFDEGVTDIKALAIRVAKPPSVVHRDRVTGAETVLYTLEVDRPSDKVSFERADRLRQSNHGAFLQHQLRGTFVLALPSGSHTDAQEGRTFRTFSIWKPGAPRSSYINEDELNAKFTPVRPEAARQWWDTEYARVPEIETREVRVIAGAIIPLWQRLKTKDDAKLRVVRVSTTDGQRIVGVEVPRSQVSRVLRALGLGGPELDPEQLFTELMEGGESFNLVSDLKLKRSSLQGEPAIELVCHDSDRFADLRSLGLLNEQIRYKQHFFIPADRAKGVPILAALLSRHPIVPGEESTGQQDSLSVEVPASEAVVVDLEHWICPPEKPAASIVTQAPSASPDFSSSCEPQGAPLMALLEQRDSAPRRGRSRSRIVIEEQGVLFSLTK